MQGPLRSFWLAVISTWTVLGIAGFFYAQLLSIPTSAALAIMAAILVEASFYLLPGFDHARQTIERCCTRWTLALSLSGSALVPYCIYSLPTGSFRWSSLTLLVLLAITVTFWYVWFPRTAAVDALFLVLMAGVVLAKVFPLLYVSSAPRLHVEILGQLMWIRLGVMVILSVRRVEGIGFGFLPSRTEWSVGIRHYLYFLPIGLPLALAMGLLRFQPPAVEWWRVPALAAGTFLGMLWVVALSEEFFFRGLLQQWLSQWLASQRAGLLVASMLFGLVHLPFSSFPNWRFALLAALAGLFYGRAYLQARSIRASMATHALVATTWRLLFL